MIVSGDDNVFDLISGISGGGGAVMSSGPISNEDAYNAYKANRPVSWLPISSLVDSEDDAGKIVMLFHVHPNGISTGFKLGQDFSVDWGDGTIETVEANTSIYHDFDFNTLPEESLTEDGYRQAIVTLLPTSGTPLSYFLPMSRQYIDPASPVEIQISGNHWNTFQFTDMYKLKFFRCVGDFSNTMFKLDEAVKLECAIIDEVGNFSLRLGQFTLSPQFDVSNVSTCDYLFYRHLNLPENIVGSVPPNKTCRNMYAMMEDSSIPDIDYSNGTYFRGFISSARSVVELPLIDLGKSNNNQTFANGCYSLVSFDIINCKKTIEFKYCTALPLSQIIKFGETGIVDLTGGTEQTANFYRSKASVELADLGTSGTYEYNGQQYTKNDILALYSNKNWELVY